MHQPETRRERAGAAPLLVLLLIVVAATIVFLVKRSAPRPARPPPITAAAQGTTPSSRPSPSDGLPILARKPTPISPGFEGCPAGGDGGDPLLNRLKNRVDSAAWIPVAFDDVLRLAWPPGTSRRRMRRQWSAKDAASVARFEGIPISVEGYVAGVNVSGPESTNCHGAASRFRDWHLWLAPSPGRDRRRAIVAEPTPATRAKHRQWTLTRLRRLSRDSVRVRVSGWLLLDTEHPEEVGKTRGTIWEIHPVMRIEMRRGNRWVDIAEPRR